MKLDEYWLKLVKDSDLYVGIFGSMSYTEKMTCFLAFCCVDGKKQYATSHCFIDARLYVLHSIIMA